VEHACVLLLPYSLGRKTEIFHKVLGLFSRIKRFVHIALSFEFFSDFIDLCRGSLDLPLDVRIASWDLLNCVGFRELEGL
jgi:hypothetical protein